MGDIKKFNEYDKNDELSDDILALAKDKEGEFKPIKGKIDIVQIKGIVPEEEVKELEKAIKENLTLDTSLTITDVKRGHELWLVALLKKSNSTAWNAQQMGVIKVRVVDYFYGLNKLHSLKRDGKI